MDEPNELRLTEALTELSLVLLTDATLKGDLDRLVRVAVQVVPECSGASVSMLVDGQPSTVATSDRVAMQLDLVQYDNHDGPCVEALGGQTIRIGFAPTDERFPHFAIGAADQRVLSVLSTPVIDDGTVVGSLNLYSQTEEAFGEDDRGIAAIFASEIATALVKSSAFGAAQHIRDRLQEKSDETTVVAQAQGLLMTFQDCSAAQAAALIRNAANDNGEAIITTAERILTTVTHEQGQSTDTGSPTDDR